MGEIHSFLLGSSIPCSLSEFRIWGRGSQQWLALIQCCHWPWTLSVGCKGSLECDHTPERAQDTGYSSVKSIKGCPGDEDVTWTVMGWFVEIPYWFELTTTLVIAGLPMHLQLAVAAKQSTGLWQSNEAAAHLWSCRSPWKISRFQTFGPESKQLVP